MTIPDDQFTTPGDGTDRLPGDFRRNSQGNPLVKHPTHNRDAVYDRPSKWVGDDYTGIDPIYANRGSWCHKLTELIDEGVAWRADLEFVADGVRLGIDAETQRLIANAWQRFKARHNITVVHTEQTVVNDALKVAGTLDRIVEHDGHRRVLDIKGLAVDTPIPTPTGWATIASLGIGDKVIGSDGRPCNVIGKSNIRSRPCYRMVLDDGTSVVADDEHQWIVVDGIDGGAPRVRTTAELAADLTGHLAAGQQRHQRIMNAAPLDLPKADLPIDPYVLGLWLADGNRTSGAITKPGASLVWGQVGQRGYALGVEQVDKRTGCSTHTVLGLAAALRSMGLIGHKHVPDVYMRGSIEQRLDLLRGLMDGDGTVNTARRRRVVFTNTDKALSNAVHELATSLGERPHQSSVQRTGFGVTVTSHDVEWAPMNFNPFAAEKADRTECRRTGMNHRRMIVSIDEIPSVPTQCIAVDSADHSYLCTESMIPTHNTGGNVDKTAYAVQLARYAGAVPYDVDTDERGTW